MAGRATPGGEGDTWRGGRHVAGRATLGGECDTWRGVRLLEEIVIDCCNISNYK